MSLTLAVDSSNDLYLDTNGNIALKRDLSAIAQACEHATKAQLGEMVLATDQGMPNFETIWNGSPNIAQFEAALYRTILGVDGVTGVIDLNTTLMKNVLTYQATITTIYGRAILNGSL